MSIMLCYKTDEVKFLTVLKSNISTITFKLVTTTNSNRHDIPSIFFKSIEKFEWGRLVFPPTPNPYGQVFLSFVIYTCSVITLRGQQVTNITLVIIKHKKTTNTPITFFKKISGAFISAYIGALYEG